MSDVMVISVLACSESTIFTVSGDTSQRLNLMPLVDDNTSPLKTAYVTPIDHVSSKTGITA